MILWQKIAAALGALLAIVASWWAGKRSGARETTKNINLEQRAGQVEVLKADVQIDAEADAQKGELAQKPTPEPTLSQMRAFIERNRK